LKKRVRPGRKGSEKRDEDSAKRTGSVQWARISLRRGEQRAHYRNKEKYGKGKGGEKRKMKRKKKEEKANSSSERSGAGKSIR